MPIVKRVTESQWSESDTTTWRELGEGFWRFEIGKPDLKWNKKGELKVRLPLILTPTEQTRQLEMLGEPEAGSQQSTRTWYRVNPKLGWFPKGGGPFQGTFLTDFMCAALGTENGKKFRRWIEKGGGPPRPADKDDDKAELELFESWLGWFEGLEVYGTITHGAGEGGKIWANFAGPMPIGSLPNQPEPEYQALARGKTRALIQEGGPLEDEPTPTAAVAPTRDSSRVAAPKRKYDEVFPEDKDHDVPF